MILVLLYKAIEYVSASRRDFARFKHQKRLYRGVPIATVSDAAEQSPYIRDDSSHDRQLRDSHVNDNNRSGYPEVSQHPYLQSLMQCIDDPVIRTDHIRLPSVVQNISQSVPGEMSEHRRFFNPTMIALPPWSPHEYLLVSRVVTDGLHQESLVCEADICHVSSSSDKARPWERHCTSEDLWVLGNAGGLRCATAPRLVSVPPTPAERCEGAWSAFPGIPGFHDPRVFWSGRGEPLIMVNSASRYGCIGLWLVDLRTLYTPLQDTMSKASQTAHPGPLMSYPSLTELTRNPASTRALVEKNWFLFFPGPGQAFLHYDIAVRTSKSGQPIGGRTIAKLIGSGYTTSNLTDPAESPCLHDVVDAKQQRGHWHQASNSLKLILCTRGEAERGTCTEAQEGRHAHVAVIHRKFTNEWKLPMRYERFFAIWEGTAPFRMLAISRFPVLMWNETRTGLDEEGSIQNRSDIATESRFTKASSTQEAQAGSSPMFLEERAALNDTSHMDDHRRSNNPLRQNLQSRPWAYFTYTPSIAWAFRPSPSLRSRKRSGSAEHFDPTLRNRDRFSSKDRQNQDSDTNSHERAENHNDNNETQIYCSGDCDSDDQSKETSEPVVDDNTATLNALNVGYLDDEVILGIGFDDVDQGFARAKASDLLTCLQECHTL